VVDALEVPIDGKGALSATERRHVKVKALEIITLQFLHEPIQTGLKAVNSLVPISYVLYITIALLTMCNAHQQKHNGTSFPCAHPLSNPIQPQCSWSKDGKRVSMFTSLFLNPL
jgi:hypothetical protein